MHGVQRLQPQRQQPRPTYYEGYRRNFSPLPLLPNQVETRNSHQEVNTSEWNYEENQEDNHGPLASTVLVLPKIAQNLLWRPQYLHLLRTLQKPSSNVIHVDQDWRTHYGRLTERIARFNTSEFKSRATNKIVSANSRQSTPLHQQQYHQQQNDR